MNPTHRGGQISPRLVWLARAILVTMVIALCLLPGACSKPVYEETIEQSYAHLLDGLGLWDGHPDPMHVIWPSYPREIREKGIEGVVLVRTLVDTDGTVKGTELVKSLHPVLDTSALRAVKQWEFIPLRERGGRLIRSSTLVPVRFYRNELALPEYPEIAVTALIQGTVVIKLFIDQGGWVSQSRIKPVHPVLDRVVQEAAIRWKFWLPGAGDRPVDTSVTVPVTFTISGGVRRHTSPDEKIQWRIHPEIRVELLWPEE